MAVNQTLDQTPRPAADNEIRVEPGQSVQEAVDRAGPGATVLLAEGTHSGNVVVTHPGVTLKGAGAGRTILVPGPVAPSTVAPLHDAPPDVVSGIVVHSDTGIGEVAVEGLTVRGFSGAGVYAHTVTGLRLHDVEAVDNVVWGLYVRESSGIDVSRCRGENSRYGGIALAFCARADAVVADSECVGNAFGVFVDNSSRARVLRNRCHGNAAGMLLLHQVYPGEPEGGVRDCLVSDNDVYDNTLAAGGDDPEALGAAGPPISGVGIALIGTERVSVVGNRLHGNQPGGFSVMPAALVVDSSAEWGGSDAVDNSLEWNTITGNSPLDVRISVDVTRQRLANNVVGASEPESLSGRAAEGTQ
ncbi:nitrous oxidase accessory protein NosD [Saccharothrix ecbatanensis]|uniref:Nitrous oxidase accessory protein NosD n=1 Tax=Saccharothrix ecbatanensis TaxID=1105145 RepID=A0A7W9HI86_9PSEU|nr:right-handed parallel beta-helix repeat-containing protein [Saccharothrix ecbatanensis]MBB5802531.1 nitrous oxidase accessory protein NosD [Saccharothrix ecbatanensis]